MATRTLTITEEITYTKEVEVHTKKDLEHEISLFQRELDDFTRHHDTYDITDFQEIHSPTIQISA